MEPVAAINLTLLSVIQVAGETEGHNYQGIKRDQSFSTDFYYFLHISHWLPIFAVQFERNFRALKTNKNFNRKYKIFFRIHLPAKLG